MHIRYDRATLRVLHVSVPAFTVAPAPGEADTEIADAPLPGKRSSLRLTPDFTRMVIDPALVPPALPDPDADLAQAITAATTLDELKAALLGTARVARVAARRV